MMVRKFEITHNDDLRKVKKNEKSFILEFRLKDNLR